MPVYTTQRATATVQTGKELVEDKAGKLTTKTATQTLEVSVSDRVNLTRAGVTN